MKNKFINKIIVAGSLAVALGSCAKKLDLVPQNSLSPEQVYSTPAGYDQVLAKIYATLAISGNKGPAGEPDFGNGTLDEGSQISFIRQFFNFQELPTDEAIVAWNDFGLPDFHVFGWGTANPWMKGMYARPIYNITLINEYLRQSTDEQLAAHNITGAEAAKIKKSRSEARFLRAFNYWVMMDLFGKSTFITEANVVGNSTPPGEISRTDLFNYIESELKAIDGDLLPVRTAEYGRVDQGAAWALLARMYLNAEIYTGTAKYTEAATYAKKVIDGGYTLHPSYKELFMADNDKCTDEIIYAIGCDGLKTSSYGNTTFFVHAASGDDHDDYGVGGGWYGYRATQGLASKFTELTGNTDKRAMFKTSVFDVTPAQIAIPSVGDFKNGLHVNKYKNIRSDGGAVSDNTRTFADIDFPVFRLAEMYLIYAEAVKRGATTGDVATAVTYINNLRERAYGNTSANINASALTTDFILDERARELYWEGHRRTDLIRYGLLTTGIYVWPWKAGSMNGAATSDKFNLYPIPAEFRTTNPNLTQNPGY